MSGVNCLNTGESLDLKHGFYNSQGFNRPFQGIFQVLIEASIRISIHVAENNTLNALK